MTKFSKYVFNRILMIAKYLETYPDINFRTDVSFAFENLDKQIDIH